jgi:hypothetical protein
MNGIDGQVEGKMQAVCTCRLSSITHISELFRTIATPSELRKKISLMLLLHDV